MVQIFDKFYSLRRPNRVGKLAVPAVIIAAAINVPKFLETELVWPAEEDESGGGGGDGGGDEASSAVAMTTGEMVMVSEFVVATAEDDKKNLPL